MRTLMIPLALLTIGAAMPAAAQNYPDGAHVDRRELNHDRRQIDRERRDVQDAKQEYRQTDATGIAANAITIIGRIHATAPIAPTITIVVAAAIAHGH